jgi:hypothetical protein
MLNHFSRKMSHKKVTPTISVNSVLSLLFVISRDTPSKFSSTSSCGARLRALRGRGADALQRRGAGLAAAVEYDGDTLF